MLVVRRPILLVLAVLTLSCLHAAEQAPGYPLYPNSGNRMPRDKVAELVTSMPGGASVGAGSTTFVKLVDGKDVSRLDTAFELMPGCHIVQTASKLLIANEAVSWRGELGSRTFAFLMKPGHTYVLKVELQESLGSSARVLIYGIEQDAAGGEVRRIEPAKSEDEVRSCLTSGNG
jgi:hypothetical protein